VPCPHPFEASWKEFNGGRCGACAWKTFAALARPLRAQAALHQVPSFLRDWIHPVEGVAQRMRDDARLVPYGLRQETAAWVLQGPGVTINAVGYAMGRLRLEIAFAVALR
jgi:hypothetical protein